MVKLIVTDSERLSCIRHANGDSEITFNIGNPVALAHEIAHLKLKHCSRHDLSGFPPHSTVRVLDYDEEAEAWALAEEFLKKSGSWDDSAINYKNKCLLTYIGYHQHYILESAPIAKSKLARIKGWLKIILWK